MRKNLLTRIKADNVQLGNKYILPVDQELKQEVESKVENLLRLAKEQQQQIITEAQNQAKEIITNSEKVAGEIVEKANQKSDNLVTEANNASDGIKEQAYKEGYDSGYNQGYQDGTKVLEEKVLAVDFFAQNNFEVKQSIIKSAELDILELIIAISEKVCQKSFEKDKSILKELTLSAIKELKDKEQIKITINPQLAEILYSISEELKEKIPKLGSIKIIEDSNISADGAIVESILSRVDSRVKTQINEIADKLMKEYNVYEQDDTSEEVINKEVKKVIKPLKETEIVEKTEIIEEIEEIEEIEAIKKEETNDDDV